VKELLIFVLTILLLPQSSQIVRGVITIFCFNNTVITSIIPNRSWSNYYFLFQQYCYYFFHPKSFVKELLIFVLTILLLPQSSQIVREGITYFCFNNTVITSIIPNRSWSNYYFLFQQYCYYFFHPKSFVKELLICFNNTAITSIIPNRP
jgi:hypothetical protein